VTRLFVHGRRAEARGRTPTLRAQADWLADRTRQPRTAFDAVPGELDRELLAAPLRVAPGAVEVLDRLRAAGVRLGLVSNILFETGEGTRAVLARLGLTPRFGAIYLSSEQRWAKPSPRPFARVLRELGVGADRAAHIGDLAFDVLGASAAGLRPLLYSGLHRFEIPPPDLRFGRVRPIRVDRWSQVPARLGTPRRPPRAPRPAP
jgi:FMN phosphatase YigB (HAD superfamily)